MKILLKSATIVDPASKHHLEKRDILIENGKIITISKTIDTPERTRLVDLPNLHVSTGWFDSSVSFGEPGYEERETIENGLEVAARSGFSSVVLNTNTNPVADTKGIIKFIKSKSDFHAVDLYPNGALTVGSKGVDLAELYDMQQEGAISFYDHKKPVSNSNLLKIALQYCQNFDGLVQSFPLETLIAGNGMVHEGYNSTKLGLKGIPSFAETLQIARDIAILEYTGGKLHIPTISTKESVDLIRKAKKEGLQISCSVALSNLVLTDEMLQAFDSNYKLIPPIREAEDIEALIEGLKDGTIDGVTSDHNPLDIERKKLEFHHADYGTIGLECCFGALNNILGMEKTIKSLTGLKSVFSIEESIIEEGENANLTLFDPDSVWEFTEQDILSTSKNTALLNRELRGKAYGIYNNGILKID